MPCGRSLDVTMQHAIFKEHVNLHPGTAERRRRSVPAPLAPGRAAVSRPMFSDCHRPICGDWSGEPSLAMQHPCRSHWRLGSRTPLTPGLNCPAAAPCCPKGACQCRKRLRRGNASPSYYNPGESPTATTLSPQRTLLGCKPNCQRSQRILNGAGSSTMGDRGPRSGSLTEHTCPLDYVLDQAAAILGVLCRAEKPCWLRILAQLDPFVSYRCNVGRQLHRDLLMMAHAIGISVPSGHLSSKKDVCSFQCTSFTASATT